MVENKDLEEQLWKTIRENEARERLLRNEVANLKKVTFYLQRN
jgi:hypothetical protein